MTTKCSIYIIIYSTCNTMHIDVENAKWEIVLFQEKR